MAVRSRRFFGPASVSTAGATYYTVPALRTAIVHSLLYQDTNLGSSVVLILNGSALATGTVTALKSIELLSKPLVLNPNDVLRAATSAAGQAGVLTGSGSLLDGAPS